jgi:hypothetical protein
MHRPSSTTPASANGGRCFIGCAAASSFRPAPWVGADNDCCGWRFEGGESVFRRRFAALRDRQQSASIVSIKRLRRAKDGETERHMAIDPGIPAVVVFRMVPGIARALASNASKALLSAASRVAEHRRGRGKRTTLSVLVAPPPFLPALL